MTVGNESAAPEADDLTEAGAQPHGGAGRPRLRLLLIASALDGTDVSENAVAYDWASRLAKRHEVTILTYRKRERQSAHDQIPEARFIEWDEWPLLNRASNLNNLMQPYYAGFYVSVRRWIRSALARGERFDLAHQLTPVAMRYPCPAIGLIRPVVIGPLAGALSTPPGFEDELGVAPWYTRLRALDQWRLHNDPLLRRSMTGAAVVLGAAPYVSQILTGVPVQRFEVMSELGVDEVPSPSPREHKPPGEMRALFVGRLIRTKGARDAVRAVAQLPDLPGVTLDIVGDGEDRSLCEAEAAELGVTDRVRFHGWLSKDEVRDRYREADVFLFPSFREPTGRVLVEAMSYGLPVIAADYGGPAALVERDVGILVACENVAQYAHGVAGAMRALAASPERRVACGAAGRELVRDRYMWPAKLNWLEDLYTDILTEH